MNLSSKLHRYALAGIGISLIFVSCAVGPNFRKPASPGTETYSASPLRDPRAEPGIPGGGTQRFVEDLDIPAQWWTLFHSKALSGLVEDSLEANPNLKAAQDALVEAREYTSAQVGAFFPGISAGFSATRQKASATLSPPLNSNSLQFNLFTPEVSVSYAPDVFGLNRRTVESLRAQAEQQRFVVEATYLTLSSNVVAGAIQEAALRGEAAATQQLIDINKEMLAVLEKQFQTGYANRLDLAAQESQLAQVVATLPPLLKELAQQRDQLSVLAGKYPGQPLYESFDLSSLDLPRELPVSLPSRLVEQRPDIRQAEENLHAACAQAGVAVANRLPNFNLTGSAGSDALQIGQLLAPGAGYWSVAAAVTQPVFEGGALLHRERAARAAWHEADDQYRATVLEALQNVADTLHALEQDGDALNAARDAEQAAKTTLDLTSHQLEAGYTDSISLLNAEQTYQQASISLVQSEANRFADTAALFQALGGGWWNR